jgi:hypothetical protein
MKTYTEYLRKFFGVIVKLETYLGLIYLLLAFPLGLSYFIFLVTGFSLGISLVIIWVGLLILLLVFAATWGLSAFERLMAIWFLQEDIPPMSPPVASEISFWGRIKLHISNPVTWKGLLYLLLKFPIGLLSFVSLVVLLSITFRFLLAPILFQFELFQYSGFWRIDTLWEAGLAFVLGFFMLFISLHVLNFIAFLSGRFAALMLGLSSLKADASAEHPTPEAAPGNEVKENDDEQNEIDPQEAEQLDIEDVVEEE